MEYPSVIRSPLDLRGMGLWGWWDFTDITTLFTDTTFATPVTALNDPIAGVLDKSGNNRHLTQATSGSRPYYKTGVINGLSAAGFASAGEGTVDDYFDISNPAIIPSANATIFIGTVVNTAAAKGLFGAASGGWREFWDGSEVFTCGQAVTGNSYVASASTQVAQAVVLVHRVKQTVAYLTMDYAASTADGSPASNTTVERDPTSVNTALFGALTGPGSYMNGNACEVIKLSRCPPQWVITELLKNHVRPKYALPR